MFYTLLPPKLPANLRRFPERRSEQLEVLALDFRYATEQPSNCVLMSQ